MSPDDVIQELFDQVQDELAAELLPGDRPRFDRLNDRLDEICREASAKLERITGSGQPPAR